MQIKREYSGTLPNLGSYATRSLSFGGTTTGSVYASKIDFMNQTIADFLANDCGIEGVAYEARQGNSNKFLWIYDVPFLFSCLYNATNTAIYGPYDLAVAPANANFRMFTSYSTGAYNFALLYYGGAEGGLLRINYSGTALSTISFKFAKAKNRLTNQDSVFAGYNSNATYFAGATTSNYSYVMFAYTNFIDLNDDKTILKENINSGVSLLTGGYIPATQKTNNPDKFPLIKATSFIWELNSIYVLPFNFGTPNVPAATEGVYPEIEIGGRSFICSTSPYTATSGTQIANNSTLNFGLIEST